MKDTIYLCYWRSADSGGQTQLLAFLSEQNIQVSTIGAAIDEIDHHSAILIQFCANRNEPSLLSQIRQQARKLKLEISFESVSFDVELSQEQALLENGLVITLLSNEFSAEAITDTAVTLLAHNLTINSVALISPADSATAVQFRAQGSVNEASWNSAIARIQSRHPIDLMAQKDDKWRARRRMICFDMDSTLIKAEVIDELAKCAGVGVQVAEITERAMRGELDFKQSFAERMALLNGLSENVIENVAVGLPLMDGAEVLFQNLRANGFKTAILSGGFTYFARVLQRKLGIDYVFANSLEIEESKLTGRAIEPIIDGPAKASLLLELADKEGFHIEEMVAVGDGANDLPMLGEAGMGVAFRAKPVVRDQAEFSLTTHGLDGLLYLLGHSVLPGQK